VKKHPERIVSSSKSSKSTNTPTTDTAPLVKPTCLLVLGMHRSGTSALTRVLNIAGATLPKRMMGADKTSNITGHWEPLALARYHDKLLVELHSSWQDWRPLDISALPIKRRNEIAQEIREIISFDYNDAALFVLKEPRICRFAPFFIEALQDGNIEVRPVLTFRNPLEVSQSLETRDGIRRVDAALLWLRHALDAEKATRKLKRAILTYDGLLKNWKTSLGKTVKQLGLKDIHTMDEIEPLVESFLSPEQRHHTRKTEEVLLDPILRNWVGEAYEALLLLASNPAAKKAQATLDRISAEFNSASPILHRFYDEVRAERLDEITNLQASLTETQNKAEGLNSTLNEVQATAQTLTEKLAAKEHEAASLKTVLGEAEAKNASHEDQLIQDQASIAELNQVLAAREKDTEGLINTLQQREIEVTEIKADLSTHVGEKTQLQKRLDDAKSSASELKQQTDAIRKDLTNREFEISRLKEKLQEKELSGKQTQSRLENREEELSALRQAMAERIAEITNTQDVLAQSKNEIEDIKRQLRNNSEASEKVQSRLENREKELSALQQTIAEKESNSKELTATLERKSDDIQNLENKLNSAVREQEAITLEAREYRERDHRNFENLKEKLLLEKDTLNNVLQEKGVALETAETKAIAEEKNVRELKRGASNLYRDIEVLKRHIEQSDERMVRITNSTRWKVGSVISNIYTRRIPRFAREPIFRTSKFIYSRLLIPLTKPFSAKPSEVETEEQSAYVHNLTESPITPGRTPPNYPVPETQSPKNSAEFRHLKVAVIAWDTGHNPVGRACLIAEALSRHFDVTLIGPQFPRFGDKVWEPIRNSTVPIITFPGADYPDYAARISKIAERIDCDVIIACKARLPSLHLGLLIKQAKQRPLIVDVDDYEPSFCKDSTPIDLECIKANHADPQLAAPYSDLWTRYCETLVPNADAVLVSNRPLQKLFGGTIIPHARDETLFNPDRYSRKECRERLGIAPTDKIVLFAGTVREHKGVLELAQAVSSLNNPTYKLCVLGNIPDRGYKARLQKAGGENIIFFPNQPLNDLPKFLMAADVVCLLQKQASEISKYQLPAKVIDALAMGLPVLATETPPLQELIQRGVIIPVSPHTLRNKLSYAFENSAQLRREQLARRSLFDKEYSYSSVAQKMKTIILEKLQNTKPLNRNALEFEQILEENLDKQESTGTKNTVSNTAPNNGHDIVLFWKQFDAGVYGRRSDMLAKYLARHKDIRRVVFIDPPLWVAELQRRANNKDASTEHQIVYKEILARRLGLRDQENLTFHTFVYDNSKKVKPLAKWNHPKIDAYLSFLNDIFVNLKIDPSDAIFWVFPINEWLPKVIQRFNPKFVITDIVDDQRAEPNASAETITARDKNYRDVIELSDMVITNATTLQESMAEYDKNIRLLPNAIELEEPVIKPGFNLERLLAIPGPRLGFVGNLESKIDIELLEFIATERPGWHIVLIGSTHTRREILNLERFSNIHLMGVIQYDEARAWMQHFDVALIPHLDTALTQSMNPLKAFVYAGLGLPIVATNVKNLDSLKGLLHIANSREEFLEKVELALGSQKSSQGALYEKALEEHSWGTRIEQVLTWLRKEMPTSE